MPSESSAALVQKLVDSFRSLLDEALVVAIASDHDLQKDAEFKSAKAILEDLAKNVTLEEASGFNPSGIAEGPDETTDGLSTTETSISHQAARTHDTETTRSDQASLISGSEYCVPRLTTFNNDSEESKIFQLQSMFMDLKQHDIKFSLKKAKGDFQAALDDLLHVQYLKETDQEQKGIDGFFQPDEEVGKKKKRRNKKKGKASISTDLPAARDLMTSPLSPTSPTSPDGLKDMKRQDEISFLADRLNLPYGEVSDIYYRKRFSSGATAAEIIDQHIALGIEAQDNASKKQAHELANKYRNVPEEYMSTVVQVTGSIPQSSEDIAALLSKHFAKNPWSQKLDINYTLSPLADDDIEGFGTASVASKGAVSRVPRMGSRPGDPVSYAQAAEKVSQYHQGRREAAAKAAQMSRRGASNPLFRQAAGFYAEMAREQARYANQASSTAADLLVEEQSTAHSIDLHGVYVQDGVRIARAKVQTWWTNLGDFRSDKARQQPFTVITGLGRHSAGGVSQLRQAVAAALLQDGWKMRVETGHFVVTGRR